MKFLNWFKNLFKSKKVKVEPLPKVNQSNQPTLSRGSTGQDVKKLQRMLKDLGYFKGSIGGNFLERTENAVRAFQKDNDITVTGTVGPKTWIALDKATPRLDGYPAPHMVHVDKHTGKKETDKAFNKYLSAFWPKSGLNYKTIIGTSFAWCGLFAFYAFSQAGFQTPVNSFRAKAWDGHGYAVDWKNDGIARGYFVRINSKGNCKSASGNHITFANGYCTGKDLTKSGATFGGKGGNQGNAVKVSIYKASTICYVGKPEELGPPEKVTVSNNCTGTGSTKESTR